MLKFIRITLQSPQVFNLIVSLDSQKRKLKFEINIVAGGYKILINLP